MNPIVLSSLIPVAFLVAIGFVAIKAGLMRAAATKDLSALVFSVLTPALLFRTMSTVHVQDLDFRPVVVYFLAAILLFSVLLVLQGRTKRAAVVALAATFSNTLTIGVPLVSLAYGQAGLVTLFTLISLHALVLLTLATVVLELVQALEAARASGSAKGSGHMRQAIVDALRNGIIHPVPLPIILGLLFARTGLVLPQVIDSPLQLLGAAMGPLALVLVGATLASAQVGSHLKGALGLSLLKTLVLPALVAAVGWLLGLKGLPLVVMVVAASLPIGANVFMFSQRYNVAEELITASVAVSTALGLVTISVVMALAVYL